MNLESMLLTVDGLTVDYPGRRGADRVRAVENVSLTVGRGECVAVVGESGSGKSTIGRVLLGLTPATSGTIVFEGTDITHAAGARRRGLSTTIQAVFQDPYSSLNPTRTIGQTLAESLRSQPGWSRSGVLSRAAELVGKVGLDAAALERYPAQFSGGQRQRIAIARALMSSPRLVIADEPVSALDLSVQAQVLNLLKDLQDELGVAYLFISHDLGIVRFIADRVIVLYRGRIVESGPTEDVFANPAHEYTRRLLEASPVPDPELQRARRAVRVA